MRKVTILPSTTYRPITVIGERAGVCWGADTSDAEKNFMRGLDCIKSGHGRAFEFVNVEMVLEGVSARAMRQWYTHIGGAPTRLQASTRYIDYSAFDYVTPPSIISNSEALCTYDSIMEIIGNGVEQLEKLGIPREDAAMLLPIGMTTRVVDKRNLRSLIDMSHQRMCSRTYWEFRGLFFEIGQALCEYSSEWATIVEMQFKPKCEVLGYCLEKHGCGRYPKKND